MCKPEQGYYQGSCESCRLVSIGKGRPATCYNCLEKQMAALKLANAELIKRITRLRKRYYTSCRLASICHKIIERDSTAVKIWAAVETLRADECTSVEIINDNPDFGGPNSMVYVTGSWTRDNPKPFTGDSVLSALKKAVAYKKESE